MTKLINRYAIEFSWFILFVQILCYAGYIRLFPYLKNTAEANNGLLRVIWNNFGYDIIYSIFYTLIAVLIIAGLKWWREAGFTPVGEWQDLHLYIIPCLLTCLILLPGIRLNSIAEAAPISNLVFYLLLGFREEAFNRGIIQAALSHRSKSQAIFLSSVLFGLIHISRLLFGRGSLFFIILQILRSTAWGFGMAVLRARTQTIIPLMILHAFTLVFIDVAMANIPGSWFAELPGIVQWLFINELPFYLIGLYGLFLLPQTLAAQVNRQNA